MATEAELSKQWLANSKEIAEVYKELERATAAITGITQTQIDAAEASKVAKTAELQLELQRLEALGKIVDTQSRAKAIRQQEKDLLTAHIQQLTQSSAQRNQALKNEEEKLDDLIVAEAKRAVNDTRSAEQKARASARIATQEQKIKDLKAEQLNFSDAENQKQIELHANKLRLIQAQEKFGEVTQNTMTALFGLDSKWKGTFAGATMDMIGSATKAKGVIQGMKSAVSELGQNLSSAASAGNIIGSSLMKVQTSTIKMIHTIDQSEISFRKATGASQAMAQSMTTAFNDREVKAMAGSVTELHQASTALFSTFRAFSGENEQVQKQLARTAIAANRVGVSFEDFSTVVEKSTRIFGDKATAAMNRLHASAVAIGETPARMVKNYIQSLDTLSQYSGPKAIRVFQGLSSMSKALGIELQTLVGVANQFDTFESAADSAAKLNAILGGPYLNSIQMLNASEEKRLQLLRGSLDATNRNWEALGRFEKKAFAAAAGFQNLGTAAAFFQGNMSKVAELTANQEKQDKAQQSLIESATRLAPLIDRMARWMERWGDIVAAKLLPHLRTLMGWIEKVNPIFVILAGTVLSFTRTMLASAAQINATAMAAGASSRAFGAMGIAMRAAAPQMVIMGVALAGLYAALHREGSPKTFELPGVMAKGFNQMAFGASQGSKSLRKLSGDLSAMHAPINGLDTEKITGFGQAVGQMGFALKNLPKENIVAVTEVIRESRQAGALGPAATARAATAFAAQGASVARASRSAGGGGGAASAPTPNRGVYITDRVQFQIGGYVFEKTVEDIANNIIQSKARAG